MGYESISQQIITGDSTPLYVGVFAFLIIFSIVFAMLILANYRHRSNSLTWYKDQVLAFKTGYIYKYAKEKEIELVYPPKADLMENLEKEVGDDLSKT